MKALMTYLFILGNILGIVFYNCHLYGASVYSTLIADIVPGAYLICKGLKYGSSPFTPGPFS